VAIAVATHALLAASTGTVAPAFFALVSLLAPPRVRSATFTTMSLFAIPGVALVLPLIGATSDAMGIQASVMFLVPVAIASRLILASAARFVRADIDHARRESLEHATTALAVAHKVSPFITASPPGKRSGDIGDTLEVALQAVKAAAEASDSSSVAGNSPVQGRSKVPAVL
jgi:hypothetical protein